MQCSSCRAVYSNGLEICPRCKTPASTNDQAPEATTAAAASVSKQEETVASDFAAEGGRGDASAVEMSAPAVSTLIEFPGAGRAARPQWRKQLSERVREIQERRAREAEEAAKEAARRPPEAPPAEPAAPQLGLVPPPDVPEINPLVAAALRRIERAYQPAASAPSTRTRGGGAATAVARFVDDEYQPEQRPAQVEAQTSLAKPEKALAEKQSEAARGLVVVSAPQTAARTQVAQSEARRAVARVIDDAVLESTDAGDASTLPGVEPGMEPYDDRGPLPRRVFAAAVDLSVVAFASSPFAAIIELTNGNWGDWRVAASMGGIVLVIMFLYLTASTALSGRTWGMSLVSLRPVDAETGLPPTTRQAVLRALFYMGSLITAGLGILYALFDAEGRAAHDHFSGTVVVRE